MVSVTINMAYIRIRHGYMCKLGPGWMDLALSGHLRDDQFVKKYPAVEFIVDHSKAKIELLVSQQVSVSW